MEHPELSITLATCTLYRCQESQGPCSLALSIKNIDDDVLIEKVYPVRTVNKELRSPLGLKFTYTPDEHEVRIALAIVQSENKGEILELGEFRVDLEMLSKERSQFYQTNKANMVKLSTQTTQNKRMVPQFNYHDKHQSIEEFIQSRQNFLEGLKHKESTLHRCSSEDISAPFTPEFTKESVFGQEIQQKECEERSRREDRYGKDLTEKIKRLLAKTREIKQEELQGCPGFRGDRVEPLYQEEEMEFRQSRLTEMPSRTSLSRVRSSNQLSRERSNCKSPFPPEMRQGGQPVQYHHHYHIYKPMNSPVAQPPNNRETFLDFQNHCRTNDSQSLSNYNQDYDYMNAKYPFKFDGRQ